MRRVDEKASVEAGKGVDVPGGGLNIVAVVKIGPELVTYVNIRRIGSSIPDATIGEILST